MPIAEHRRDWEDLSRLDPFWAILSDPSKQFGGWDREEFLERGTEDVARVMERAAALGHPHGRESALDFGCGAGRLTRALSGHFAACTGVDISEPMIDLARELNADREGCRFVVNTQPDLGLFEDASFDLVLTEIVLQHLPGRTAILTYVREFVRVLRPGGLLEFQLPSAIPPIRRLQPRPRAYGLLRSLGVPADVLYRRLRLQPIRMRHVPQDVVRAELEAAGAHVLAVDVVGARGGVQSATYFATRD